MMDNDRGRRLLRLELKLFRQLHVDARGIEQFEQFCLVLEAGARRIAKAVTGTLVVLMEQLRKFPGIMARDSQFFANTFTPQFRQCLGALNTQTVEVEIVCIVVRFEKLLRILTGAPAYSYQMERHYVHAARLF